MIQALVGSRGVIGQIIVNCMPVNYNFNSDNIDTMGQYDIGTLIVAAPSGNRLSINQDCAQDTVNIRQIIDAVNVARPEHIILISSIDSVVQRQTPYGQNRYILEQSLSEITATTILRLSTLIGSTIQKNILYDIKHKQFLECINPNAYLQWCLLDDLPRLISSTPQGQTLDVVSEPIKNQDIIDQFCPGVRSSKQNIDMFYNQQPYIYSRAQIFSAMSTYLNL